MFGWTMTGRGSEATVRISGRDVKGFFISPVSFGAMRDEARRVFKALFPAHTPAAREALVDLYSSFGFAESCYDVGDRVFSIRRQLGPRPGTWGPARGWIQIEPDTAIDVIEQADAAGARYREPLVAGVRAAFNEDLKGLRTAIKAEPDTALQPHGVGALVLGLKLGNLGFRRTVPDWPCEQALGPEKMASCWKKRWNTAAGAGTPAGFLEKTRKMRGLLDAAPVG